MSIDVDVRRNNGGATVALSGELDIAAAPRIERELRSVELTKPQLLVLDLRALTFMDSTGIRIVIGTDSRARSEGRQVRIVRGPEQVQRLFRITRLDERLEFIDEPPA